MSSPKKRHLIFRILVITGISLALLAGAFLCWWTKIYIPRLRYSADQHWAAIGRPMPEFEKKLERIEENDSLRALMRDLEPFGVKTFYKVNYGSPNPNTINIPKEITNVINPATRGMDDVGAAAQDFSYLSEHASDLDRLYQGILQREPAIWSFVPEDGMTLSVPSYLTARNLSQLIYVDALHRLEHGDEKGAKNAIVAGLKMTSNVGEQPIMLSLMIRVAIEGLFAEAIARLPADPTALKQLAAEVAEERERWRAALQTETWAVLRAVDYFGMEPEKFRKIYQSKSISGKVRLSLTHSLMEGDYTLFAKGTADQVSISERVRDLAVSDLGVKKMHEAASHSSPILTPSYFATFSDIFRTTWYRSWIRLNAVLLLREQAELIRATRAQVQAGKSGNLGEPPSIVVPGAKWLITGDSSSKSVSLKLTPLPAWTTNSDVIEEKFFLLPLDGSKSWTFRQLHPKSQAEHVASK